MPPSPIAPSIPLLLVPCDLPRAHIGELNYYPMIGCTALLFLSVCVFFLWPAWQQTRVPKGAWPPTMICDPKGSTTRVPEDLSLPHVGWSHRSTNPAQKPIRYFLFRPFGPQSDGNFGGNVFNKFRPGDFIPIALPDPENLRAPGTTAPVSC